MPVTRHYEDRPLRSVELDLPDGRSAVFERDDGLFIIGFKDPTGYRSDVMVPSMLRELRDALTELLGDTPEPEKSTSTTFVCSYMDGPSRCILNRGHSGDHYYGTHDSASAANLPPQRCTSTIRCAFEPGHSGPHTLGPYTWQDDPVPTRCTTTLAHPDRGSDQCVRDSGHSGQHMIFGADGGGQRFG